MNFCVSAGVMRESDALTIQGGVSGDTLMARVAKAVFDNVEWKNKKIYILCGKGNNGGDGYALACLLAQSSMDFTIFAVGESKSSTSRIFIDKLAACGIFAHDISQCDYNCDVLVDCIFGVGFDREPGKELQEIFDKINACRALVVSVDIPSGLNSDNGLGMDCVKADLTVAIQSLKRGHLLSYGKDKCGVIVVADIGIDIVGEREYVIDRQFCSRFFAPRLNNTNKGTYGKSVIIGGSSRYVGAVKLAETGMASLRAGCGLNCIAVAHDFADIIAGSVVDSTIFPLASRDGHIVLDEPAIDRLIDGAAAVAVGMGMGDDYDDNREIIEYILGRYNGTLIIDADGLNSLQGYTHLLADKNCRVVITPHPKEMARLCDVSVDNILSNPVGVAQNFARKFDLTVLLKGTSTVITDGKTTYIVANGVPAQAKGGSGDVLSGVIAGLAARKISPVNAAAIGAFICAEAAKKAVEKYGEYGTLASDCAKEIGQVVLDLERCAIENE